jgi:bifunctional UDP-N-acetylglucosamine pyrophosphorylase/glucosamine-1-phosphate N-acetyltransferase
MTPVTFATVILAAGQGRRMMSALPKVLHEVAGRSMLGHVLEAAAQAGSARAVVVVAPDHAAVRAEAAHIDPSVAFAIQARQLGTADAVKAALPALEHHKGAVLVAYGDTPLLRGDTLARVVAALGAGAALCVLGFRAADPFGYGRLIVDDGGELVDIREELDASAAERSIDLCNSGVMAFRDMDALGLIHEIGNDNRKQEFYLTDIIAIARRRGLAARVVECGEAEVMGVNSRAQLAQVEGLMQARLRARAMDGGVTLRAPETVYLSHDTSFGTDVEIEPHVIVGPGVTVGSRVTIHGHSHLAGAILGDGVSIGPFARLRPGTRLGDNARVGNFVEVKNATVETGAKINHLSYVGDARVGAAANVGAGTITCNYDGFAKHHTDIGAGAFIGSNSALVAPVRIGDGAYVGSGSVITEDVEADALAFTRTPQVQKEGWAARRRGEGRKGGAATSSSNKSMPAKG